jgi:hypothetical protein
MKAKLCLAVVAALLFSSCAGFKYSFEVSARRGGSAMVTVHVPYDRQLIRGVVRDDYTDISEYLE